jgi:Caspase domain
MTLSFEPTKSRVVLIGTTCCEDEENLPSLPAVENNIKELAKLFCNPEIIGLPANCVETIMDAPSATVLLRRLVGAANSATDTLLVYYSGHGIKSSVESGLFVATRETTQELCFINGVEWLRIQKIIAQSPAAKKILIFDCCYSGEILAGEMGGAAEAVIANALDIRGTYSISSGSKNSQSFSLPNDPYTGFTGRLIETLTNGVSDKVEAITLDRLFEDVKRRIASYPRLPAPQKRNLGEINEFALAKNVAWASDPEVRLKKLEQKHKQLIAEKQAEIDRLKEDTEAMAQGRALQEKEIERLQQDVRNLEGTNRVLLTTARTTCEEVETINRKLAEKTAAIMTKDEEIETIKRLLAEKTSSFFDPGNVKQTASAIFTKWNEDRLKAQEAARKAQEDKRKAREDKAAETKKNDKERTNWRPIVVAALFVAFMMILFLSNQR